MARDDDNRHSYGPENRRRQHTDDEDNPFIAFRRFADDQFNTLVAGLNAIPDMLSDVRARANETQRVWSQDTASQEETSNGEKLGHDGEQRRRGRGGWRRHSSGCGRWGKQPVSEEGKDAAILLLLQAREGNVGVDAGRILDLYRDDTWGFGGGIGHDETWLSVDWFKHSPYSPIQVEQHKYAHQHGSMWRAAFEDLMAAELGKEMKARDAWSGKVDDQKLYQNWAQTGTDWMLGLQCRGVLPPQLPSLYRFSRHDTKIMDTIFSDLINKRQRHSWWHVPVYQDLDELAIEITTFDKDEIAAQTAGQAPATELDAYESFLGKAHGHEQAVVPKEKTVQVRQPPKPDIESSRILSSLSTTEQTTLPDGTVTTKITLKKRFADGREESTETVSTTRAHEESGGQSSQVKALPSSADKNEQPQKKGSWFWS